jgi:endonuclease III
MLMFNMRRPDMAVDTHIHRLAVRAGWVPSTAMVKRRNKAVRL